MSNTMTQEEAMNMSNEQAVQILIPMRNMMYDQNGCPISDAVFALDKAIEALSAPGIDIAHCGECEHGEYREDFDDYLCDQLGLGLVNDADFFCSYGERRG